MFFLVFPPEGIHRHRDLESKHWAALAPIEVPHLLHTPLAQGQMAGAFPALEVAGAPVLCAAS